MHLNAIHGDRQIDLGASLPPCLDKISLQFDVSQDEEYVHLNAIHGDRQIDLGARSHNYLLLTLARARLEDQSQSEVASATGWQYVDELASSLGMDETHLNVLVFRCRRHFGEAGILGAAGVVERRKSTRQIRLGVSHLIIKRV